MITVLLGIPLAADHDRPWWGSAFAVVVAGCAFLIGRGLSRRQGPRVLPLLVLVATAAAVGGALNTGAVVERSDAITNWLGAGIAGGMAVAAGPVWGVVTLISMTGAAVTTQSLLGGHPSLLAFLGPISYCLGGAGVHIAARRGFVTTEQTISATTSAASAQRVIEERWRSARNDSRRLHDTVLSTLTVLSHQGAGLSEQEIRRVCRRDLEILGGTAGSAGPFESPATSTQAAGDVVARTVRAAVADAAALGLEIRVHGLGSLTGERISADVAAASRAALVECLRNVQRHSGVQVVDLAVSTSAQHLILVVVDEGSGFDPDAVPGDRLGLLGSVRERIMDAGGTVTVWSRIGFGTSVVINVPISSAVR